MKRKEPARPPLPATTPKPARPGLLLLGSGTLFASMVLSGFIIGYWIDVWLDTKPFFMLAFAALGLVGGMLKAHKLLT